MAKRLFIDLDICSECPECVAKCSYFYHPQNNGVITLLELATYSLICRQCEEGTCVKSCPNDALEKQPDSILRRYNLLCISCKSCSHACPFRTIYPELIPYFVAKCDWCLDRIEERGPDCVNSCPPGAVRFQEVKESPEEGVYFVGDNLAIRSSIRWQREEAELKR